MGIKAFILAGLLMGFIFSLMHGMTNPRKLLMYTILGGIVGTGVLLLVLLFGYTFTPIKVK